MGKHKLTEKQSKAIDLLMAGMSFSDITDTLKINAATFYRWRTDRGAHAEFQAALNQARQDAHQAMTITSREKLRELVTAAYDVLSDSLESDDEKIKLKAAALVLDMAAKNLNYSPSGSTDAEEIRTEDARREAEMKFFLLNPFDI